MSASQVVVVSSGVVVGAEVAVAGCGIGKEVPDDDDDRAGDGDEGFELAAAFDEAAVALAEERVGLRGGGSGLAEGAVEVAVAFAGLARSGSGSRLDGARRDLRPRGEVAGGGE